MSETATWADAKEKELRMGSRDKRVGWYTPTLDNVPDAQRDLLERYSKIPPDRVIPRILEVVSVRLLSSSTVPQGADLDLCWKCEAL